MNQLEVWRKFFFEKFHAYEAAIGRKASVTEFAEAISLKAESGEVIFTFDQPTVSHLFKDRLPNEKQLKALAKSRWVGPEAWKAAGWDLGEMVGIDHMEEQVIAAMRKMSPEMRRQFAKMIEQQARKDSNTESVKQFQFQGA